MPGSLLRAIFPSKLRRSIVKKLPMWMAPARLKMGRHIDPFSSDYAVDRGTSIHRHYLRKFLKEQSGVVKGTCLEFMDPYYTQEFGGSKVEKSDVAHISDENPLATVVCDLTKADHGVPENTYDCIICT